MDSFTSDIYFSQEMNTYHMNLFLRKSPEPNRYMNSETFIHSLTLTFDINRDILSPLLLMEKFKFEECVENTLRARI